MLSMLYQLIHVVLCLSTGRHIPFVVCILSTMIRNCTLPLASAEETTVLIENKFMSSHIFGKISFKIKLLPWWWVVCLLPTIQLDPEYNPIRGLHAENLQTRYLKFFLA